MQLHCLIKFDTLHVSMNAQKTEFSSTATKITAAQIEAILKNTDWNDYWQRVDEQAAPEIEAYRQAEARSRARAAEHWFL